MQLKKTQEFIIDFINQYANSNNISNLIVGISGGIDSSLTSTLCAKTKIKTTIVSMPIHQNIQELKNAEDHAKWLENQYSNIEYVTIDLTEFFEKFRLTIPEKYHSKLGLANSRARIRMITLYQIATQNNGIVVGTGNKIEDFGIGFFTKYGDGGVDISPIADLNKSEVKKLAIFCGIKKSIISADPTDGLWEDDRTDEKQIGATYEELEWAMNFNKKRVLTKREEIVKDIYHKLNKKNQHKIQPIPICKIPIELRN
ncbi:MAG: NAD(+) synthase [Flavobacteriales bacterium]|nr:NAD(+) synthase [Flavobacteriales bacterium]